VVGTSVGLFLLAGIASLIWFQLTPWKMARDLSQSSSQTNYIPVAPTDQSIALLNGIRVEADGFSMMTPWHEGARSAASPSTSVRSFKEGAYLPILIRNDSPGIANVDRGEPDFVRLFGADTLKSESALMTAAMYTTPEQVKWWKLPRQNTKVMHLILLKMDYCHQMGRIYAVNFGVMHGFQEGEPNVAPYRVLLNLFDPDDHRYEIWISGQPGKPLPLTQAQLNAMIASIHPDQKN
jgi:hypothetical protein